MTPFGPKPKILIVDDKRENLYTLEKLLASLDVEVHQTTSGFEAVELTVKHDFAVAIVDVQMPEMDGYELVEFLRHNHSTKTLPVIFVSAIFSDEYHHRKGYEAGAVDFMSKPFNPDILLSKVKVFLELYHQRRQLQAANDKLAKRALELETSSQVAQYATSILELKDLLPEVVSLIQAMFNYYFVGLWLVDEGKKKLVLQAGQSCDGRRHFEPDYVLPLDTADSMIISAYQSGEHSLANDVTNNPQYLALSALPNTRSELALPLRLGTEIIGILDFHSDQLDAFDRDTHMVLQMLADQVSTAIHNARVYGLEKKLRRLEAQKAQELAELNANKDRFFSIVAHDLRGPFMPLLGTMELMADTPDTMTIADYKDMADSAHRATKNVYNLLENLLQWSRLQRGRMDCEPVDLDLQKMAVQATQLLAEIANSKGIGLESIIPEGLLVYADENMLATIIRNLTSNALKFTPSGGQVTISAQPCTTPVDLIEISVADTGVGISKEDQAKLFRLDEVHTTEGTAKEQGTGLGLVICQEMVQKNGGQIWIESEVGQGTSIKFTVPVVEGIAVDWASVQPEAIS